MRITRKDVKDTIKEMAAAGYSLPEIAEAVGKMRHCAPPSVATIRRALGKAPPAEWRHTFKLRMLRYPVCDPVEEICGQLPAARQDRYCEAMVTLKWKVGEALTQVACKKCGAIHKLRRKPVKRQPSPQGTVDR